MTNWKYLSIILTFIIIVLVILLAGIAGIKMATACSMTVITNATCNGSVVTVNSTANTSLPYNQWWNLGYGSGGYAGGPVPTYPPTVNPPHPMPAPEFPPGTVPALCLAIIGVIVYMQGRNG